MSLQLCYIMFKELKNNTSKLSEIDNRIKEDSRIKQIIEKSLDKTLTEKIRNSESWVLQ